MKVTTQGICPQILSPSHGTIKCFPTPHLTTTSLKVYLLQFLLLNTHLTIKKKLQNVQKDKKQSLERQGKHQNQTYRDAEIIRPELKTTVINMLRALMDKVDGMQEQMHNVSRERWKF